MLSRLLQVSTRRLGRNGNPRLSCNSIHCRLIRGDMQFRQFHKTGVSLKKKDYYEVLGVDRDVDEKKLKAKFRELAKKHHPDANSDKDATAKFQEIKHAYEVLSDPEKRKIYDQFGDEEATGNFGFDTSGFTTSNFSGFNNFSGFGNGPLRRSAEEMHTHLHITFMEAIKGCNKIVEILRDRKCKSCGGTGAAADETPKYKSCRTCDGTGIFKTYVGGLFEVPSVCHACNGEGQTIINKCKTCGGEGVEKNISAHVFVKIPPGADNGMIFTAAGMGHEGKRNVANGDLQVSIVVGRDPQFHRHGLDIISNVNVPLVTAILGGTLNVNTLDGTADVTIQPGLKHKDKLRLRGKGVPDIQQKRIVGDHIIVMHVESPTKLTDRQVELLKEFDEIEKTKKA